MWSQYNQNLTALNKYPTLLMRFPIQQQFPIFYNLKQIKTHYFYNNLKMCDSAKSQSPLNLKQKQVVKEEEEEQQEDEVHNGSWNDQQHEKYIFFIDCFRKQLNSKEKRKTLKIFKIMASFIVSRSSIQCRSHHIKLMRTHKSVKILVNKFKIRKGSETYCKKLQKFKLFNPILNQNSKEFLQATGENQKTSLKEVSIQTDITAIANQGPRQPFAPISMYNYENMYPGPYLYCVPSYYP